VVDYRRGRDLRRVYKGPQDNHSRNRYYQPDDRQHYNGQRSNGRQLSNGQRSNDRQRPYGRQRSNDHRPNGHRSNGQQRSYASVTRAGTRTHGDNSSRQRHKEPGYKPQFFETRYPTEYQNQNSTYNNVRANKQNHNNKKYDTQYKSNAYPTNRNSHQEKKQHNNTQYENNTHLHNHQEKQQYNTQYKNNTYLNSHQEKKQYNTQYKNNTYLNSHQEKKRYNTQYKNNTHPVYRNSHQEKKIQSEDPDFLLKAHCIHTIIKTIHHLKNVSAEDPPPNIAKMTEHLATVIKPASPHPDTQALIEGNAKNWCYTTMMILRDHYTDEMETQIIKLNTLSTYHWQNPLDVASSWAKRNLGRRLQEETLVQTAALLTAQIVDRTVAAPVQPKQSVRPTAVVPSANTSVAQVHAPPAHIGSPSQTPAPHTSSTHTANPKKRKTSLVEVVTKCLIPPSIILTTPAPKTQGIRQLPRLTPRGRRVFGLTSQPPAHSPPPSFNPCVSTEEDSILVLSPEVLEDALVPAALPPRPSCPVLSRSPVATRSLDAAIQSQLQINTVLQSRPTPPEPVVPTRRPNRHLNTVKKLQDWSLSVGKKWLIMGDSNLARLPPFTIDNLQIDSYPGATFRHAEAILKKATSSTVVEKVILSFGINNRSNQIKKTTLKQLQAAVRAAKSRFPQAAIWIPIINYSYLLPHHEQKHLLELNEYITQHLEHIPQLPSGSFGTEKDHVHWTKSTAKLMLQHWCEQVN